MAKLTKEEQKLLTVDGFMAQFYVFCTEYMTQEEAYNACERKYFGIFGCRKYANFESFREVKNRKLRK